jgi:hypothetical protein
LHALEVALGAIEASLKALLDLEGLIDEAVGHVVEAEEGFAAVGAGEFPIIYGHAFDLDELGWGLGLPFGFQILEEAVEFRGVLVREDEDFGAQPVAERVEADILRIFGSGALKSVLPVGGDLLSGSHKFRRTKPIPRPAAETAGATSPGLRASFSP